MKIKGLTLLFLTFTLISFAQSDEALEAKDFFWGDSDIYKNATEIPEKWVN